MHLLVRDTRSLDDDAPAEEPGQTPAPLVALSFSDADLSALAAAWNPANPELRLANLGRLRHPLSVDLYLEQIVGQASCVVIRLLGGLDYWRYGAEEAAILCRDKGIALALLPGNAPDDQRLRDLSTIHPAAWTALNVCFQAGGPANMELALSWSAHLAGLAPRPTAAPTAVPQHAVHTMDLDRRGPLAVIIFYRSHLLSADIAPIEALIASLRTKGFAVATIAVASLKAPETAAWITQTLTAWQPAILLNATAFSAQTATPAHTILQQLTSPLDAPQAPILQLILASTDEPTWTASSRGLSATDLAMQVVLPELDGRLLTTAISFKTQLPPHPTLQYARTIHAPHAPGIAQATAQATAWSRLAAAARQDRRIAIILSNYPGIGGQQGHAVGLDTFASLAHILETLAAQGYTTATSTTKRLTKALCTAPPTATISLQAYNQAFAGLPPSIQSAVHAAWGSAAEDPALQDGYFHLRHLQLGHITIALQPSRATEAERRATYHDPDLPPRHAYIAFHLWLRTTLDVHALVQLGTHGSLEWLPGKAAALSPGCLPQALLAGLPVIYPFIVNNPGEAAPAKRRLAAVTIGHLTPPIGRTEAHGPARELERMIDEYAAADGLDRRRTGLLRGAILERAESAGLLAESGVARDAAPDEALARLDAYLCDVKDLQVRDGLHVYGQPPASRIAILARLNPAATAALDASPAAEMAALMAALDGRFVPPGPAGAPTHGRIDVLPTGRNLTTIDPRAVPTTSAIALAHKAAETLLRRHVQQNGDWPRTVMLDLWASASMRTGGEDLALAYILLGARPTWDDGTARVSGFEILPLALLDRPRIDVTLRISGLFRDAFASQIALFAALVRAIATRDEAPDWNPLAGHPNPIRVYGAAPGQYGAGDATAATWLQASATAYRPNPTPDPAGLAARVAATEAFIHTQDHAEIDLLDSPETAAHEGGFAAAAAALGATPTLYHLDTSTPETPKPRLLAEEIARIVRGRAANPTWIAGMMRHGYRGAAEIARPLAALEAYARTLPTRFDAQFDLLHEATLADPTVATFLETENPEARNDLVARFQSLQSTGLWHPRRNIPPC